MIEIHPCLWIGSQNELIHVDDGNKGIKPDWYVITAAKEPWHREALGYKGRGAPKDSPEYLIAERPGRLILNLVDVDDPAYIREEIVEAALTTISIKLSIGLKVLVHCNQGQSRAPTIGLLWLRRNTDRFAGMSYADGVDLFKALYPSYAPAKGMAAYAEAHWETP